MLCFNMSFLACIYMRSAARVSWRTKALTSTYHRVPAQTTVSIPVNTLIERNLKLSGNLMGGYEEAIEVMSYIQSGHIKPLITEVPLEDVPKQMQALADCEAIGKVVVKLCDMPCIK